MSFGTCSTVLCSFNLDIILICSKSSQKHVHHVTAVLQGLLENSLFVKANKNVLTISFLGYIISEESLQIDPAKVSAVSTWPVPETWKQLQRFLCFPEFCFPLWSSKKSFYPLRKMHMHSSWACLVPSFLISFLYCAMPTLALPFQWNFVCSLFLVNKLVFFKSCIWVPHSFTTLPDTMCIYIVEVVHRKNRCVKLDWFYRKYMYYGYRFRF